MVSQCLHGFSWVVRFSSKDTVGLLVDARLAVGESGCLPPSVTRLSVLNVTLN